MTSATSQASLRGSFGDRVAVTAIVAVGLAVSVVVAYLAVVVGAGSLAGIDQPRTVLTLAATALVAVCFEPMRRRLAKLANRLVYGHRSSPWEAVSRLSAEMGHHQPPEEVLHSLAVVIRDGIGAGRVVVWLRVGPALVPVDAAGAQDRVACEPVAMVSDSLPDLGPVDLAVPIRHGSDTLGAVTVTRSGSDPILPIEVKLVQDLAAAASIATRTVRLQATLRRRLDVARQQHQELLAARARTAAAQLAERQRLERNLHDTCQQRAVTLAGRLGLAGSLARTDPDAASGVLAEVDADIERLAAAVSRVAEGLPLPNLLDDGIGPALHAETADLGVRVDIDDETGKRLPADVEEGLYLCCMEAIQNAVKHAAASRIEVRLYEEAGGLTFSVRDDGLGFDTTRQDSGTGLASMQERLRLLDGRLILRSGAGGSEVTGHVPLRSGRVTR